MIKLLALIFSWYLIMIIGMVVMSHGYIYSGQALIFIYGAMVVIIIERKKRS